MICIGLYTIVNWKVEYTKQLQGKSTTAFLPYKQVYAIKDELPTPITRETFGGET
jgi:hypothetical protein